MPITNMYLLVTDKIIKRIKFPTLQAYGMLPSMRHKRMLTTKLKSVYIFKFMSSTYNYPVMGCDTIIW